MKKKGKIKKHKIIKDKNHIISNSHYQNFFFLKIGIFTPVFIFSKQIVKYVLKLNY